MKRVLILCTALLISSNIGFCSSVYLPPLQPVKVAQPQSDAMTSQQAQNYGQNDSNPTGDFDNNAARSGGNVHKRYQNKNDMSDNGNQLSDIDPMVPDSTVNYPKINEVEKMIYGKTYQRDDLSTRLTRIEKSMFKKTFDSEPLSQRVDNIVSNFSGNGDISANSSNISKIPNNVMSRMEQKILGQTFPKDDEQTRLSRMEQQVLGAAQSGSPESRYKTLSEALNRNNPGAYDFDNQLAAMQPKRGLRGFFSNLGQAFSGGTMTGFTPPIDSFDLGGMGTTTGYSGYGYNNSYNNYGGRFRPAYTSSSTGVNSYNPYNSYNQYRGAYGMNFPQSGMYRGIRTNTGYSDAFRSYGNGCGVTILN